MQLKLFFFGLIKLLEFLFYPDFIFIFFYPVSALQGRGWVHQCCWGGGAARQWRVVQWGGGPGALRGGPERQGGQGAALLQGRATAV